MNHKVPHDEGMPSLQERAKEIKISREGMPQNIGIPKPAPIPDHIDLSIKEQPQWSRHDQLSSDIQQQKEQQKNAVVGLWSVLLIGVLLIICVIGWLYL